MKSWLHSPGAAALCVMRKHWLVFLLLLVTLPGVALAQFTFATNADNTLTITRYIGPGGVVAIPSTTETACR